MRGKRGLRKFLLWALILALAGCGWAAAEDNYYNFFRSLEGQISFTLPSVPQTIWEADLILEEGELASSYLGWRDKVQLTGHTTSDGEYQVHCRPVPHDPAYPGRPS